MTPSTKAPGLARARHAVDSDVPVSSWMTASPHCIAMHQNLAYAQRRMTEIGVRHLPVLDGGQLVGVISDRDLVLLGALAPERLDSMCVEEAMSAVPYCVPPETPMRQVAQHMATRKVGSAIVVDHGKVLGVFTTTDALSALGKLLGVPSSDPAPQSEELRVVISNNKT